VSSDWYIEFQCDEEGIGMLLRDPEIPDTGRIWIRADLAGYSQADVLRLIESLMVFERKPDKAASELSAVEQRLAGSHELSVGKPVREL